MENQIAVKALEQIIELNNTMHVSHHIAKEALDKIKKPTIHNLSAESVTVKSPSTSGI